MINLTIDTGPWLDLLDNKGSVADMRRILSWHEKGLVQTEASNRVFDPDTWKMTSHSQDELRELFKNWKITIVSAGFRLNISRLSGADRIGPNPGVRSSDEWIRFRKVVGSDPTTLPASSVGKRLHNKIADYDALEHHYGEGRDVFITTDTRDYLAISNRQRYRQELGIMIMSPSEFVREYAGRLEPLGDDT